MADAKNNNDEPSIEEILSSIRDIISEDDEREQMPFDQKPAVIESPEISADDEDDDIIDLTEMVEDEDKPQSFAAELAETSNEKEEEKYDPLAGINLHHPDEDELEIEEDNGLNDILGISDNDSDDADVISSQEIESEMNMAENVSVDDLDAMFANNDTSFDEPKNDEALIDKVAETASVMAFAKLAENIAVSRTAAGTTLEDIVRDLMRPMLKDWLDDNLPILIERIVTKELERLAEKAVRK